jgi:chorismate mutase
MAHLEQAFPLKTFTQKPLIISGPCSAETEEQVIQTAMALKAIGGVDAMRAGIWKPRTRPGNFEGVGEIGLRWLKKAKKCSGLPMAVEVATAKQVDQALAAGIDILWIGARTTANPFSVQEVADALKGVRVPVLIKNPINPELELWIGALERVQKAGVEQTGLIHRGFSAYGHSEYRNVPTWQLAIEMKRRYNDLPFLVDPSHICGNRYLLKSVVQSAIDLDYDGILIESHIHPDSAWSDAQQQITPEELKTLLQQIVWRKEGNSGEAINENLERLRRVIDNLDDEILRLLNRRMEIAEEIGKLKKENNITILQTARWNKTLERIYKNGEKLGLTRDFIKQYFDAIHMESIKHQDKVMN